MQPKEEQEDKRLQEEIEKLAQEERECSQQCESQTKRGGSSQSKTSLVHRQEQAAEKATELLSAADGVQVLDERVDGGYPTAVTEGANNDASYVGRIREDISHERGLDMWVVSDNVRKGAALNSVQIAEILIKQYL